MHDFESCAFNRTLPSLRGRFGEVYHYAARRVNTDFLKSESRAVDARHWTRDAGYVCRVLRLHLAAAASNNQNTQTLKHPKTQTLLPSPVLCAQVNRGHNSPNRAPVREGALRSRCRIARQSQDCLRMRSLRALRLRKQCARLRGLFRPPLHGGFACVETALSATAP